MPVTPVSLLGRLRESGQGAAWDEFVELYSPLLYFWARRFSHQDADAADLVQEVFAILVRKLPEFEYDPAKGFRSWLRIVTTNKWREILRKRARDVSTGGLPVVELRAPPDEDPFWENEHRQLLTRRLLEIMQAEFQPSTWQACWKSIVESRSAADVGVELNLTEGAVRAAKFRVLNRLREEIDGLID